MNGFQLLLTVIAINAGMLGVALLAVYTFNRTVSGSGR
jgi:hypothetical protein